MKTLLTLVIAIGLILLLTRMQDYFALPDLGLPIADKTRVSYYLSDFSMMAIKADGSIGYEISARHLSHWQADKRSEINTPLIRTTSTQTQQDNTISAEKAQLNHATQQALLQGAVIIEQTASTPTTGFKLHTTDLLYDLNKRTISTHAPVNLTSPTLKLNATGLEGKLDEESLRLNSHVRSTYTTP